MHVAFFIHNLHCGGAERVTALLAGGLCRRGYEVSILTLAGPQKPFYQLPVDVKIVPLDVYWGTDDLAKTFLKNANRLHAIRKTLRRVQPDAFVGVMTECNVLAVLATRVRNRMPFPVIVNERVHPALTDLRTLACTARVLTFPLADAVVTCSRGMAPWYRRWLPAGKIVPIQNPVVLDDRSDDPDAEEIARTISQQKWILSMGRLADQKG